MKRALVLCGGGSLGSYEIGAWRKLKEKGLTFDIVTGASIGAINGAMVVMDDYDTALKMWEKINTDEVMRYGIDLDRSFWGEVDFP
jgi:NTE family protein